MSYGSAANTHESQGERKGEGEMNHPSEQLQIPAEKIFRLEGVLSVTVGKIGADDAYTAGAGNFLELQKAGIKMLESNKLDNLTIVIEGHRILVERWNELACATVVPRAEMVNKSVRRTMGRTGHKYDRRDPDDTQLGKALGDLERSDPKAAQAADDYSRVKQEIIDGRHA